VSGVLLQPRPQFTVIGQIPFEILHHYSVFHKYMYLMFAVFCCKAHAKQEERSG